MDELDLLKKYISLQAEDEGLWFVPQTASEDYLQQELRRIAWLIEDATCEQIKDEIALRGDSNGNRSYMGNRKQSRD